MCPDRGPWAQEVSEKPFLISSLSQRIRKKVLLSLAKRGRREGDVTGGGWFV